MNSFTNILPTELQPYGNEVLIAIAAAIGVLALAVVWRMLSRGKSRQPTDDIADFHLSLLAPAPPVPFPPLLFEGQPARLRMMVMAPPGRNADLTPQMAESVLQSVYYGLGKVFRTESPYVQVWPPQLSQTGFAPIFFRRVARPEPAGALSRWILVAGPARAGSKTVLLGMALEVDEPSPRGNVRMKQEQWSDKLRLSTQG